MPGLVGGYGNYFLPVQCGAPDYFIDSNKQLTHYSSQIDLYADDNPKRKSDY